MSKKKEEKRLVIKLVIIFILIIAVIISGILTSLMMESLIITLLLTALFIGIMLNIIPIIIAIIKQKNVFGKLRWRQKITVWLENNYCPHCGIINKPIKCREEIEDIPTQNNRSDGHCGSCGKLIETFIYK
ncbi:MAG: hypothetical protein AB1465_01290 [Patescibacteria group bacterium]